MEDLAGVTAMDNLYPALVECFAVILCGYVAGRMNLISETEAKGLNTFVGTFSLPALIFLSLSELDLSSVNWLFLLSILIAKSIVFIAVIILTLAVSRPINFGRSGLFAIFCTQSNDFAIGYPIVVALYQKTHPEFAAYLYLMAPISLAILNPMGFILMEIEMRKIAVTPDGTGSGDVDSRLLINQKFKMILSVAKGIALNPIVFMTVLGIVGNLIFKHDLPIFFTSILKVLGDAFSATALFLLGLRMVGKVHKLQGAALVLPGILIIVKLLVLPVVTRETVSLLHSGYNETETLDLSTYGFLYGTFPSAPGVFVFATRYNIDVDLIASSMVACTFLSAPLMFISAKMISWSAMNPSDYIKELDNFAFDISIAAVIACVWILLIFTISKKYKRIPQRITMFLVLSQLFSGIGVILWSTVRDEGNWTLYFQFIFFTLGVYSSRIWTSFLAVALLFLQCRSLCFVLKLQPIFIIVGWGVPLIIASLMLVFDTQNSVPYDKRNPNFQYGSVQAGVSVFLLILCFIVTVGCLVLHQRYRKRYERYLSLIQDISASGPKLEDESQNETDTNISDREALIIQQRPDSSSATSRIPTCSGLPTINEGCCEESQSIPSPVVDIEDLLGSCSPTRNGILNTVTPFPDDVLNREAGLCPTRFGCHGPQRDQCHGIVRRYQSSDTNSDIDLEEEYSGDSQILRHIVLLILLLSSMFVGLALSIWTLVMDQISGIYVELAFLDATLNFGQSLIVFAVFGVDLKELIIPVSTAWRRLYYGEDALTLPAWDELSFETKHICDQFVTHHLEHCQQAIAKDKRWRLKIYKQVFKGTELVDWLIEIGLAKDRIEASNYARHLVEGRVLRHINNVHHFYDRNILYTLRTNQ